MILAIVGSCEAEFDDAAPIIRRYIFKFNPDSLVSGDADGIDKFSQQIAKDEFHIPVLPLPPEIRVWDGDPFHKIGFKQRNLTVAQTCNALLRIVSRRSRTYGSGWTRDRAKELGKPTFEEEVP